MDRLVTTIVLPEGPPASRMFFLGEAPGEMEDYKGKPFQGPAGQMFDKLLRTAGIARGDVLVGNVFLQRPPGNNIEYFFQDSKMNVLTWEGQEHVDVLKQRLEEMLARRNWTGEGPNVLVALGAVPLRILTGKKRISKWRGSVLECTLVPGFKVYGTYHPSAVMRQLNEPEERRDGKKKGPEHNILPVVVRDLERAMEQAMWPEIRRPKRDVTIVEQCNEAVAHLRDLQRQAVVSVDIETLPSETGPIVWCIGFSPEPGRAIVVPFIKALRYTWAADEELKILREISKLFLSPMVLKVFQLGSFDTTILGKNYGLRVLDGTYADTGLLHHACYPYLPKSLSFMTSTMTQEPYYKDDGKVLEGKRASDYAEYIYNGKDCCVTREIWSVLKRDAHELGTWSGYQRTIRNMPILLYSQIIGTKIDVKRKAELTVQFRAGAALAQKKLNALAGQEINIGSPVQMSRLLYGQLGCPIQVHHETKKPTTDKDAINRLKQQFKKRGGDTFEILNNITIHRKLSKLAGTYTEMEIDADDRVRTSYYPVSTYRLASSESHFGKGGSLQQIPKKSEEGVEVKKLWVADPGMILVGGDLRQAEAMEVAWLSGDRRLIDLYLSGEDVHWGRAKEIFGFPPGLELVKSEDIADRFTSEPHPMGFYRDLGKTIVHAGNYKMGPGMMQMILLRMEVFVELSVCKQLLRAYLEKNPLLLLWHQSVIEQINATRTLTTPLGRKRIFRGRLGDNLYRSAIAFVPQSTVGELLQTGAEDLYEEQLLWVPLLPNVHDEAIGQCSLDVVPAVLRDVKRCLEIPHEVNGRELCIPCDPKIGYSWAEMEEIKDKNWKEWLQNGSTKARELVERATGVRGGN